MRFIHTFCSKPLLVNKFGYQAGYSDRLEAILIDYTYSALCVKEILGQQIVLYADETGAEILKHIPYDEVKIVNGFDTDAHFAASIKFEAIKDMTKDDVLIDGDLFIQNKRCLTEIENKNSLDFVYSFFEPWEFVLCNHDEETRSRIIKHYEFLIDVMMERKELFTPPYSLPEFIEDICWPNTSFMKFNNMKLKNEYIKQYHKFKNGLTGLDFKDTWPDVIIEQYHMKKLLEHGGYTSAPMVPAFPEKESNNFALAIGFTHLGGSKHKFTEFFRKRLEEHFGVEMIRKVDEQYNHWMIPTS